MAQLHIDPVTSNGEIGRIVNEEIANEYCKKYILYGEDPTCLAENYLPFADSIKNFEVQKSDVWMASYPRSGTTWIQEMVWLIATNLDFEGAKRDIELRFPFLELSTIRDSEALMKTLEMEDPGYICNSVEFCAKQERRRFLKTHLPVSLLPVDFFRKLPKIIYVWRNPKDVCVSYYHHGNLLQGWRTKLDNFCKVFLADRAQYGSYWNHVLGYWGIRHYDNILYINYEDAIMDLPSITKGVGYFLGRCLTDYKIARLCDHLSFDSMKNNKALNRESFVENLKKHNLVFEDGAFIRTGMVGQYHDELSPQMIKKFDCWIKESIGDNSFQEDYDFNI